jgi:tetratricopeptide (TPR) repeat protein
MPAIPIKHLILSGCLIAAGLCSAQQAGPEATQADLADGLYNRAKNLYNAGNSSTNLDQRVEYFTKASEVFKDFLDKHPRDANAKAAEYYYALCFYNTGNIESAKRIFSTIISNQRNGPYVAAACSVMASDAFEKKDYATAAVLYSRMSANAQRGTDRMRGFYFEALSQHYRGREKEALAGYLKVISDPEAATSPHLHLCRNAAGALLLKMGQPKEALPYFEDVIKAPSPENAKAEATLYAGITNLQLEDEAAAEKNFQSILSNRSDEWRTYHADALTSIMQIRFNKKQYAEVVQIYASNPLNSGDERQAKRANVAARSHMLLGHYLEAIPLFLDVQKISPDSDIAFDASYNRLLCFYKIDGRHIVEQVDAFIEIYGKSQKNHPRIHAARMMKAGALQNDGKIKEAAETYNLIDSTLIAESNRANLLYQRGWCLANADDHQGAIRSFTKFVEEYPADKRTAEAIALRGESYLETSDRDAALKDFNTLIGLNPGPKLASFAWQKSAVVKKLGNDMPGMIECYTKLLEKFKDLPAETVANAEFYIGYGLNKQNNNKEAIAHLEKARELDSKTYGKRAGLLLISCYFQLEQIDPLCKEIDSAIDSGYSDKVSPALVSWAGVQSLGMKKAEQAARFFLLIANPEEPRGTPRDVWRHLGKALILCKDYKRALPAIENVLSVEDNPLAKADALLDQGRCHLAIKDLPKARKSIEECFALKPQGALEAEASILFGDLCMAEGSPAKAKEKYAGVAVLIEDARLKPLAISRLIVALETLKDETTAAKYRKELAEKFPNWHDDGL